MIIIIIIDTTIAVDIIRTIMNIVYIIHIDIAHIIIIVVTAIIAIAIVVTVVAVVNNYFFLVVNNFSLNFVSRHSRAKTILQCSVITKLTLMSIWLLVKKQT